MKSAEMKDESRKDDVLKASAFIAIVMDRSFKNSELGRIKKSEGYYKDCIIEMNEKVVRLAFAPRGKWPIIERDGKEPVEGTIILGDDSEWQDDNPESCMAVFERVST